MIKSLSLFLVLTAASLSQTVDQDGRAVVERSINKLGGKAALAAVESFSVTGSYELRGAPAGAITLHFMRPDKLLFSVELGAMGSIRSGFDGRTAWRIDPQGARILQGDTASTTRKWVARGFSLLPSVEAFSAIGPPSDSTHDGTPCTRIEVTLAATGETYSDCFDPDSGLLIGRTETIASPAGRQKMLGWVGEYRKFGSVVIPTEWRHKLGLQEWTATYEQVELNRVDPSVFALPPEIQALVEAASNR